MSGAGRDRHPVLDSGVVTDLRNQLQQSLGDVYRLERELGGGGMSRVFLAVETALGRELRDEFVRFAERFGKTPNRRWRVSVTEQEWATRAGSRRKSDSDERIAFDPEICGGRPRIAGTRVRVSDIVAALAEGASPEEILEDFPYLSAEDISAALSYAARAVDHRILKAA